jgi:hypothetical protein
VASVPEGAPKRAGESPIKSARSAGTVAQPQKVGCPLKQANESQSDDATNVVDRKFGSFVTATLIAVSRVPPGPDLTGVTRVQIDGKAFSKRIKMEFRIRAPLRGHWPMGDFYILQDATELHVLSVEDPGAVARFQYDGVHDTTMASRAEAQR